MLNNLYFYVYFSQEWLHIGKPLMKLIIYLFSYENDELLEKYNKILENVKNMSKKKLILYLYTTKNIWKLK